MTILLTAEIFQPYFFAGSVVRSGSSVEERLAQGERNLNSGEQGEIQRIGAMRISKDRSVTEDIPGMYPRCYCLLAVCARIVSNLYTIVPSDIFCPRKIWFSYL